MWQHWTGCTVAARSRTLRNKSMRAAFGHRCVAHDELQNSLQVALLPTLLTAELHCAACTYELTLQLPHLVPNPNLQLHLGIRMKLTFKFDQPQTSVPPTTDQSRSSSRSSSAHPPTQPQSPSTTETDANPEVPAMPHQSSRPPVVRKSANMIAPLPDSRRALPSSNQNPVCTPQKNNPGPEDASSPSTVQASKTNKRKHKDTKKHQQEPSGDQTVWLYQSDLDRFKAGAWLNDMLVDFGLRKSARSQTRYATTQSELAYEGVQKWTKYHDLFTKDLVITPIRQIQHWYSIILLNPGKLFDSPQSTSLAGSKEMLFVSYEELSHTKIPK
ncbi:putative SUMO deconjugating cysteine peptidase Ulp2 [Melampsora larici-populina 98AG31]|uniref:Putative SUMO deconjugating cysteine peptidase Ulp2 n=1 Tax=Melampsora larici-populina (strain 98AG31 / pathotype 3-4-7) TaxID=747676 RepID=F4S8X2_MELLP|nr:putative SUMO deconjugating cysteine peptidase Ulp2 [Melampsora larici-populina 98AG31]EGF98916.1 putative SUMO deconjugating cysteine peptidase Ulp2 [Melampsora larici-populina 98AG31]